ncbi:lipoprotein insertase outer membrane protein LolB [Colwellia sp. MEBiC06753]
MNISFIRLLLISLLLTGCAQSPSSNQSALKNDLSGNTRIEQLQNIKHWQISGQIAFLQESKREKASIFWQKNSAEQRLNLTTYLGINVLSLTSDTHGHVLEVEGKKYRSDNLDELILQLTGLDFPSDALSYWLKALPYSNDDLVALNAESQLPDTITSFYQNKIWQIQYQRYKQVKNIALPSAILIKQQNLTIKLAINDWSI